MSRLANEIQGIRAELNGIKRQNRRLRSGLVLVCAAIVVAVGVGMTAPGAAILDVDQVTTKRLVVEDQKGRERVVIMTMKDGIPGMFGLGPIPGDQAAIILADENRKFRAMLAAFGGDTLLQLFDAKGNTRAQISGDNDAWVFKLKDGDDNTRVALDANNDQGSLSIDGKEDDYGIELSADHKWSRLSMTGKEPQQGVHLSVSDRHSLVQVRDAKDVSRASMVSEPAGPSYLVITDQDGKVAGKLP